MNFKNAVANTDGSVNKLVTVFAGFLLSIKFIVYGAPGYAHLPAPKILYHELFIAPAETLYRDTAPSGFDQTSANHDKLSSPLKLYRDYASPQSKLHHDGKNCATPRSRRAYKNCDENAKSCRRPLVDSAPFTNTYRRAVSVQPDKFDSKMNMKLTVHQKLKHYSICGFLLFLAALPTIDLIKILTGTYDGIPEIRELMLYTFTCLTASTLAFWIKKRQLAFKEFHISCSSEDFIEAAKITSKENKWKNLRIDGNDIIGQHDPFFSIRLIINIKRNPDKILINCMHDLDSWSEGFTLGWRSKNIRDYISNLKRIKENPFN